MPPFFHELPVDAPDADTAAERLHSLATTVLPQHPSDDQYAFAVLLGAQLEPMTDQNVIYAGLCFLEVEGEPTSSTVLVAQLPHDSDDETIIPRLLSTLREAHPDEEVETADLPCGPAVYRIGASPFTVETSSTGAATEVHRQLIQAYVPLPGTAEMLVFELGVFSASGWELHSELFAEILKTIDWATDQEIAEAAQLAQNPTESGATDGLSEPVKQQLAEVSHKLLVATGQRPDPLVPEQERLSATVCQGCWGKGLRAPCLARHEWQLTGLTAQELVEVIPRVGTRFSKLGWNIEELVSRERFQATTDGYAVAISVQVQEGKLFAEASSTCSRQFNTSVADDFG